MADDPDEELFAGVAVEEAAIGGFCALAADALMSTGDAEVGRGEEAGGGRVRVRSQSLEGKARGAGRISDSTWGGSAIRSRRAARLEDAAAFVGRVGRKTVGSWDEGDGGGCPSAFTDCSGKCRDRCSGGISTDASVKLASGSRGSALSPLRRCGIGLHDEEV